MASRFVLTAGTGEWGRALQGPGSRVRQAVQRPGGPLLLAEGKGRPCLWVTLVLRCTEAGGLEENGAVCRGGQLKNPTQHY